MKVDLEKLINKGFYRLPCDSTPQVHAVPKVQSACTAPLASMRSSRKNDEAAALNVWVWGVEIVQLAPFRTA